MAEARGKQCSKCDKTAAGTAKFCAECGGSLVAGSSPLLLRPKTEHIVVSCGSAHVDQLWAKDTLEGDLRSKGDVKQTEPLVSGIVRA